MADWVLCRKSTYKFIEEKTKESRKATIRSYTSITSIFQTWADQNVPNIYSSTFSDSMAAKFMDYVYNERKAGGRSYNNKLKMLRSLFNWMIEKFYAKQNPFNCIPANIAKNGKERHSAISQSIIDDLLAMNLEKCNPNFYLFGPNLIPNFSK